MRAPNISKGLASNPARGGTGIRGIVRRFLGDTSRPGGPQNRQLTAQPRPEPGQIGRRLLRSSPTGKLARPTWPGSLTPRPREKGTRRLRCIRNWAALHRTARLVSPETSSQPLRVEIIPKVSRQPVCNKEDTPSTSDRRISSQRRFPWARPPERQSDGPTARRASSSAHHRGAPRPANRHQ